MILRDKNGRFVKTRQQNYCIDCKKKDILTEIDYSAQRCQSHANSVISSTRKVTKEHGDNISKGLLKSYKEKNRKAWNYGLTKDNNEILLNESKKLKGRKLTETWIKNISIASSLRKHTPETKSKLSLIKGGTGIPYEFADYPQKFNENLKEQIRKRDNYQCQNSECNMTEEEYLTVYGKFLDIHHIDYNKMNLNSNNLITLCRQCNARANFNREYWKEFYSKLLLSKVS